MNRNISVCVIVTAFLLLASSTAFSAVWRVNPKEGAGADFLSINSAIASVTVVDGDTLYLEGADTSLSTGVVYITKTLNIIGPGYFLDEYPDTQANIATAEIPHGVHINSGSSGSLIKGVTFTTNGITINTSNITIERCKIHTIAVGNSAAADNAIIMKNYIANVSVGRSSENVIITNNIITGYYHSIAVSSGCTAGISNNVLYGNMTVNSSTVTNNILRGGSISSANSVFYNNIGNGSQFGTENGNQSDVVMTEVFLWEGTTDGKYQLATGSPAIGAGVDGVDCGVFGGDTPYVLAGLPDYPTIYYFTSPLTSTQDTGLQVNIKTKVNN